MAIRTIAGVLALGWWAAAALGEPTGVPGPVTTVQRHLGLPALFVDGEPYLKPVFETYSPRPEYFAQFGAAGCEVHMFSISLGPPVATVGGGRAKPMWLGPNEWDFSELDARAAAVLAGHPDGYLMPRFYMDPPNWWLAGNVSECQVLDTDLNYYVAPTGNAVTTNQLFVSLASEKWRRDMEAGVKEVIRHIQASDYGDRVFGYMVTGLYTEEFYHWSSGANQLADYSEPFRRGFQAWLRRKYGTDEALRKAWNRPEAAFDTVSVPSAEARLRGREGDTFRDPARDMPVVDFYLYYNEVIPETIELFCKWVKEATANTKIVGAFYGFMFEFAGDPEYGHNALARYAASPYIDYMAVTSSYSYRELGTGADYARSPWTSLALHGKLWYADNDTLSYRWPEVMGYDRTDEAERRQAIRREAKRIGAPDTLEETLWQYRRITGLTLGMGWYQSFFDLHGGYFDDPALMAEVGRLVDVLHRARHRDRSSVAEILAVYDEPSCAYGVYDSRLMERAVGDPQVPLMKLGAPHDAILIDDLDTVDMGRYRLVLFMNTYQLTDEQRDLVRDRVLKEDRTVLWVYAPGLFNGARGSVEAMADLTGMHVVPAGDPARVAPRIEVIGGSGLARRLTQAGLTQMGPEEAFCRLFSVEDPDAETVGVLPGSDDATTLAVRAMPGWTSVYAVTNSLPAGFYRALAEMAGVHLYNDRDDTLYASKSYLTLSADGEGERTLRFPQACDVIDALTEETVATHTVEYTAHFRDKETRIYRIEARRDETGDDAEAKGGPFHETHPRPQAAQAE